MKDIHGKALCDYVFDGLENTLYIHTSYGETEEMPLEVYFREGEDLTELERNAIANCKGNILDVGAGAGAITLILQNLGYEVTALEKSAGCCKVMKQLGIKSGIEGDLWDLKESNYDTLLLLMNGIGVCGELKNVRSMVSHLLGLLKPGGRIIFDSSDISYLYEGGEKPKLGYFGNVSFQFEYLGEAGEWFNWLYIDWLTLQDELKKDGVFPKKLFEDTESGAYLAVIEKA